MRILQIIPNLRKGGAERLVLDICHALKSREGIEVKLVVFAVENDYQELSKGINIEVVSSTVTLSLFRKNILQVEELQHCINTFRPDIIHSHLFQSEMLSRSCTYPKAKWFTHIHDNMPQLRRLELGKILNRKTITDFYEKRFLFQRYKKNKGNHFIAISKHTNDYIKSVQDSYKSTLLLNAIDYNKFFKLKNLREGFQDEIRLVNIGSFVDKKNQSFLLGVIKKLRELGQNVKLDLLGDGKNRQQLEQEIISLSLQNNVTLHGLVDRVEEYLWKADLYVHSATYEPLGLVLLEGMAAGLPVVCLDGYGNRDLIESDKNGYMITENDSNEFAEVIDRLVKNPVKYAEMSSFCQEYARSFDIKKYADSLIEIYENEQLA